MRDSEMECAMTHDSFGLEVGGEASDGFCVSSSVGHFSRLAHPRLLCSGSCRPADATCNALL